MPVKDFKKYLNIGKVCNTKFGVKSNAKSSTESVTLKAIDDELLSVTFIVVVNYISESIWLEMRKRWIEEGTETIKAALSDAEERYKELTGSSISFSLVESSLADSSEVINFNSYSKSKKAYFRLIGNAKIG